MILKHLQAVLLPAVIVSIAWCQTDVGRITGTVSDSSGAVVPGATITVTNEKTGQARKVAANEAGLYIANQLPPAIYSISVSSAGMAPSEYKQISLQVGQERTVNVSLQPAAMSTEVNVSGGELVVIDLSSARVGANVSSREVADLPMNGRQVSQLYLLAPGAVNNGSGTFDNIRVGLSAAIPFCWAAAARRTTPGPKSTR